MIRTSGNVKLWKETVKSASAFNHESQMARIKYCGGCGSNIGTVKDNF